MKPIFFGLILGFLLGLVAGVLSYGSLWLPLTAASITGFAFYYRIRHHASVAPSACAVSFVALSYLVMFFGYPEYRARTAKTAMDHYNLAFIFLTRAQFFPDEARARYHWEQAAAMGLQIAELGLGTSYLYGTPPYPRDKETARYWLQKAAAQGGAAGKRAEEELKIANE